MRVQFARTALKHPQPAPESCADIVHRTLQIDYGIVSQYVHCIFHEMIWLTIGGVPLENPYKNRFIFRSFQYIICILVR
jgi:hypothetical protein